MGFCVLEIIFCNHFKTSVASLIIILCITASWNGSQQIPPGDALCQDCCESLHTNYSWCGIHLWYLDSPSSWNLSSIYCHKMRDFCISESFHGSIPSLTSKVKVFGMLSAAWSASGKLMKCTQVEVCGLIVSSSNWFRWWQTVILEVQLYTYNLFCCSSLWRLPHEMKSGAIISA